MLLLSFFLRVQIPKAKKDSQLISRKKSWPTCCGAVLQQICALCCALKFDEIVPRSRSTHNFHNSISVFFGLGFPFLRLSVLRFGSSDSVFPNLNFPDSAFPDISRLKIGSYYSWQGFEEMQIQINFVNRHLIHTRTAKAEYTHMGSNSASICAASERPRRFVGQVLASFFGETSPSFFSSVN